MIKLRLQLGLSTIALLSVVGTFWFVPTPAQAVVNGCCEYRLDPNATTNAFETMTDTECEKTVKIKFYPAYVPNKETPPTACIAQPDLGDSTPKITNPLDNPILSVGIPGLSLRPSTCTTTECTTPWLGDYIGGLYKYGITAIALLAVIGLMIGGILWTSSAGNDERVGDAKKWIGGSLMGVLISLTAYTVLKIINPALTELSPIKISTITKMDLEEVDVEHPGDVAPGTSTDNVNCPPGVGSLKEVSKYFMKSGPTYAYTHQGSLRGSCSGSSCLCDCSWFAQHVGKCSKLPSLSGEGTSEGLYGNSNKIRITANDCDHPSLTPGSPVFWRETRKVKQKDGSFKIQEIGHVMTYLGDNEMIECGGGYHKGNEKETRGSITLSDWSKRCKQYLMNTTNIPHGAYYLKR